MMAPTSSTPLKVLLVGSGGREHAIVRALSQSPLVSSISVAPGNGGTSSADGKVQNVNIKENDFPALIEFAKNNGVNLVVPGPEAPLVAGIESACREAGIPCFGPSKAAAQLEGSKAFSKDFMRRYNIPTAAYKNFTDADLAHGYLDAVDHDVVIKASGIAAGKGVIIPKTKAEAHAAIDEMMSMKKFGSAGDEVVIEEFLQGEELSFISFCDGYTIRSLPPAQDHKQAFDGDQGPMTGGMGCYSPCVIATPALVRTVQETILQPTLDAMRKERTPFRGILFTGLMITKSGPKVLEYNVRFGDPETETLLPFLKTDLAEIMLACVEGWLSEIEVVSHPDTFSATVIAAAPGYPGAYPKNLPIQYDVEDLPEDSFVYHAGTTQTSEGIVTSGGRVLAVNGTGPTLELALESAYMAMSVIEFKDKHYRRDIAHRDLERTTSPTSTNREALTYASAGVSVDAGNSLVTLLKPIVKPTLRPGGGSIGGFGGVFDLNAAGYTGPKVVIGTDGVGTKLNIARAIGKHDSIGIDCVAMNVNDLVVQGAEPLMFVDVYTCGKLDVNIAASVISGVATGCVQAGAWLAGGETAEMPGIFTRNGQLGPDLGDEYDLCGTAVGVVRQEKKILPWMDEMKAGDVLIGLSSAGCHSNGFSLVRKIIERSGLSYTHPAPWDTSRSVGESLLTPTRIYVKPLLRLVAQDLLKGMAHITGGGLVDNIPRMLPKRLAAEVDVSTYEVPAVFKWLKKAGNVEDAEFAKAFNTGLGMVAVVAQEDVQKVVEVLKGEEFVTSVIGRLVERKDGAEGTILTGLEAWGKW